MSKPGHSRVFWRAIEYKNINFLFRYGYEGDTLFLTAEADVDGIGMVTSSTECTVSDPDMSVPQAGQRWLMDLSETDFQQAYTDVMEIYRLFFHGGEGKTSG